MKCFKIVHLQTRKGADLKLQDILFFWKLSNQTVHACSTASWNSVQRNIFISVFRRVILKPKIIDNIDVVKIVIGSSERIPENSRKIDLCV